jgi:glucose/arabinose dehydrogenase
MWAMRGATYPSRNRLTPVAALIAMLVVAGCGSSSGTSGVRLVAIGAGLYGPKGMKATVYARGLALASAFAFDARGRLWVATSGADTHGTDGVYVVAGAGTPPRKVITHLHGPLGLLWYRGALYVSSIGRVDAFSGLHGMRFTKRRTVLRGPVAGGENNNLVLAPDGRILMGVTASCDHCTPGSKWSGSIVSFRPDGTGLRLYASRIRAAFGLTFYPGTNDLLATMNQRDDLGTKTPGDWLALVRQGEDWGFPACYGQGGAVCTGVPKPLAVLDPHAAAGGVAVVGTSALVAEWQRAKVLRITLARSGTTYKAAVSTFLTGLAHPLPVVATKTGGVLVGDWGSGVIYEITKG